jgi:type I restriction-modification system DNA methylase subunit
VGIRDLIEHFAKVPLGNSAARADSLGQSYEYLIKKFADAPNKKAGELYTPRSVVNQMVRILYPHEGATIDDPACGTCGMPHGARFRMGAEGKIRQKLLGMDIPDAVIGLGQNLFYGTGLAACILVKRMKKPAKHRNKVLIVDVSKEFKKGPRSKRATA